MAVVLDASAALSWHFEDESPLQPFDDESLDQEIWVPAHWHAELANGLLMGERARRTDGERILEFCEFINELQILTDVLTGAASSRSVLPLARDHKLTAYDAFYVELAVRRRLPILTADKAMAKAARALNVPVIGG